MGDTNKRKVLDPAKWKEFRVGDLFEIVNSKAYHSANVEKCNNVGSINYLTRIKFNNGITSRVKNLAGLKINPKGTISFGAENANFFIRMRSI